VGADETAVEFESRVDATLQTTCELARASENEAFAADAA